MDFMQSMYHTNGMAKLYFSMKTIIAICGNLIMPFVAEVTETYSQPSIIMFYIMMVILFWHELLCFIPGIRKEAKKAFEMPDGRINTEQLMASYFTLWCIRLYVFGKLFEAFFQRHPFQSDGTYYQTIVIILILVGVIVIRKGATQLLMRWLK